MKKHLFIILTCYLINTSFVYKLSTDYRDNFTGRYYCVKTCQAVNSSRTGIEINSDSDTIVVTKDIIDSILNIEVSDIQYRIKLTNKKMLPFPIGTWSGRFYGADSIGFAISSGHAVNLCIFNGKKL